VQFPSYQTAIGSGRRVIGKLEIGNAVPVQIKIHQRLGRNFHKY
jgi:hypothetical protein